MSAATALIAGNDPLPELAAEAVAQAMARAGLTHAAGVLLFLTPDFARTAHAAVLAASRAGNCLQVTGGIAAGVANERSWAFDRPAAVAMVFGGDHGIVAGDAETGNMVCIATDAALPRPWRNEAPRSGLLVQDPLLRSPFPVWQQGRLAPDNRACVSIVGGRRHSVVSSGLRRLGPFHRVDATSGYDLSILDNLTAAHVLQRELPADMRATDNQPTPPLHHLCVMLGEDNGTTMSRLLPIVAINNDGSLTLGNRVEPGEALAYAIRQPVDAERELQARLGELAAACAEPEFGLFFSCIGRGPFFYSGEDRDWILCRERFPHMPFIGAYGNGQIASVPDTRALQNCVVLDVFAP